MCCSYLHVTFVKRNSMPSAKYENTPSAKCALDLVLLPTTSFPIPLSSDRFLASHCYGSVCTVRTMHAHMHVPKQVLTDGMKVAVITFN